MAKLFDEEIIVPSILPSLVWVKAKKGINNMRIKIFKIIFYKFALILGFK
jgi:hypothetical protein